MEDEGILIGFAAQHHTINFSIRPCACVRLVMPPLMTIVSSGKVSLTVNTLS